MEYTTMASGTPIADAAATAIPLSQCPDLDCEEDADNEDWGDDDDDWDDDDDDD